MENPNENIKLKTKAEIDAQINDLQNERLGIVDVVQKLQSYSKDLFREYAEANVIHLPEFKDSLERLTKEIDNPTLSEKLLRKFAPLFDDKNDPKSRESYINRWSHTRTVESYRKEREDLEESVNKIADLKDLIRELIGEDLSFTGGKIEGQEKSNREKAFEKIAEKVREFEAKVSLLDEEIKQKREEALEVWKRENAEEAERLENEQENAEAENAKLALFEEFKKTKYTGDELIDIILSAKKSGLPKFMRATLEEFVKFGNWNYDVCLKIANENNYPEFANVVLEIFEKGYGIYNDDIERYFKLAFRDDSGITEDQKNRIQNKIRNRYMEKYGREFLYDVLMRKDSKEIYEYFANLASQDRYFKGDIIRQITNTNKIDWICIAEVYGSAVNLISRLILELDFNSIAKDMDLYNLTRYKTKLLGASCTTWTELDIGNEVQDKIIETLTEGMIPKPSNWGEWQVEKILSDIKDEKNKFYLKLKTKLKYILDQWVDHRTRKEDEAKSRKESIIDELKK